MTAPAPGWFADPAGPEGQFRWWDGRAWTRWLSSDATAPVPPSEAPPRTAPASEGTPVPHVEPSVRMPLAAALVVGAVAAAVVAVGAVVAASASRLPSGPAVAPPSPTAAAPTVEYDATSRAASVRELRWVLPGRPYDCDPDPQPRRPSFDSMLICAAPVHENYSGSQDWTATTGLGVLPASMVVPGNLQRTADRLFGSLRGQFFADQKTQVRKLAAQRFDRAPAGKALAVSGEVHYAVAGVPSRYDRLVVLVVELADGGYGAWFSSRPDDTPAGTLKALDDSIASLTAQ